MMVNNAAGFNKANNQLSPSLTEHKTMESWKG